MLRNVRRAMIGQAIRRVAVPTRVTAGSAIIIAPHPDDEVLGCGGLIALKRQMGARVTIVLLTDGEASHRNCCSTTPASIAARRRELAVAAGAELGLVGADFHMLGFPDGAIPTESAFDFDLAAKRLAEIMATINPDEIYAPHPGDVWPDHEAASVLVQQALATVTNGEAIKLLHYPVWLWHSLRFRSLPSVLGDRIEEVDISTVKEQKHAAISTYLAPKNSRCGNPVCGSLPHDFLGRFSGNYEYFMDLSRLSSKDYARKLK